MKKIYLLLIGLCLIIHLKAQESKTVEVRSGNLSSLLTEEEKNTITSLTLTGTVDARDFIFTSRMPLLTALDLSQTKVTSIDTIAYDRVAISHEDTIGSYGYNPRESGSLFSSRLASLKLPSTLKAIDVNGFSGCSGLTAIEIPTTVTSIGLYAFYDCTGLTSINIPASITYIEKYAFHGCSGLKELTISPSIGGIEENTFSYCSSLKTLTIPFPISSIGMTAFMGCTALTSVILPESLNSISFNAFLECPAITSIYSYNPTPPALGGGSFDADKTVCVVYVPYGSAALYATAEGWKDFKNIVEELPGFSVSPMIVSLDVAGQSKTIEIDSQSPWTAVSDQSWLTVNPAAGDASGTLTVIADANETSAYRFGSITVTPEGGESQVIRVIQKSSPVVIDLTAGNLAEILAGEDLDTITNLTLTGTINAMDIQTINAMPRLTTLNISQTTIVETTSEFGTFRANAIGGLSVGKNSMGICGGLGNDLLKNIQLPPTLNTLTCGAFYGCGFSSFVIPPSVSTIGWEAFNACTNLTSITIPSTVTFMDQWAFSSCTGLKEIIIEEGIEYIPRGTFAGCSALTSLTLPASMKGIDLDAFNLVTSLDTIYTYNPVPPYAEYSFRSVDKSACVVYVPAGAKAAYAQAEGWKEFKNIIEMVAFTLSSTELSVEAVPIEQTIQITTEGAWSTSCDKDWLVVSPAAGDSSQTVTLTCRENTAPEPRTTTVTFSDGSGYSQTVTLTQKARINSIPVANAGEDQSVEEGEPIQLDGTASMDPDSDELTYQWTAPIEITLSSVSDAKPFFTAPKLERDTIYNIVLVVNDGKENSVSDTVLFCITNKTIELGLSTDAVVFENRESSAKIIITGNSQWTAQSDKDWLTVNFLSCEGQKEITLTANANDTYSERVAIVTVSAPEATPETITVTQHGLVTDIDRLASPMVISCYPNPFTYEMSIDISNPSLKEVNVEVYGISGQKIKSLAKALKGVKIGLVWDGTDEQGKQVPEGLYLLKVNEEVRKVVKN